MRSFSIWNSQSYTNRLKKRTSFNSSFKYGNNKSIRRCPNSKIISTRLIVMLITINISFCLFSMPMAILQIIYYTDLYSSYQSNFYQDLNSTNYNEIETIFVNNTSDATYFEQKERTIDFLHAIAELLQYLNHGSSFILYSMSGKMFRNETKEFFRELLIFFKKIFCLFFCKHR